jgi:hypothetical protein
MSNHGAVVNKDLAKIQIAETNAMLYKNKNASLPLEIQEDGKIIVYRLNRSKQGKYRLEK